MTYDITLIRLRGRIAAVTVRRWDHSTPGAGDVALTYRGGSEG